MQVSIVAGTEAETEKEEKQELESNSFQWLSEGAERIFNFSFADCFPKLRSVFRKSSSLHKRNLVK